MRFSKATLWPLATPATATASGRPGRCPPNLQRGWRLLRLYYDLDTNDGDVITGLAAWNTSLYIFKRHSVYYAEYTGLADAPFSIRRPQGALGALSGWTVRALDWGVVFRLSGPRLCIWNGGGPASRCRRYSEPF